MSDILIPEEIVGNLYLLSEDTDNIVYDFSLYSRIFFQEIDDKDLKNVWSDIVKHAHVMVIKCKPVGRISGYFLYEFDFLCKEKLFGCFLTTEEFRSYFKSN
jgi:hypothetical protein